MGSCGRAIVAAIGVVVCTAGCAGVEGADSTLTPDAVPAAVAYMQAVYRHDCKTSAELAVFGDDLCLLQLSADTDSAGAVWTVRPSRVVHRCGSLAVPFPGPQGPLGGHSPPQGDCVRVVASGVRCLGADRRGRPLESDEREVTGVFLRRGSGGWRVAEIVTLRGGESHSTATPCTRAKVLRLRSTIVRGAREMTDEGVRRRVLGRRAVAPAVTFARAYLAGRCSTAVDLAAEGDREDVGDACGRRFIAAATRWRLGRAQLLRACPLRSDLPDFVDPGAFDCVSVAARPTPCGVSGWKPERLHVFFDGVYRVAAATEEDAGAC